MKVKHLLILIYISYAVTSYSQVKEITFRTVSPAGGFSFKSVHSITQDNFGYIWMASFDGVLRYNAKQIEQFVAETDQPEGLPSNRVTCIISDQKNRVWASTDNGLAIFDRQTQCFSKFDYTYENGDQAEPLIKNMIIDGDNILWLVDRSHVGFLNFETKQLIRITDGLKDSPALIYKDETNQLWLGTNDGSVYHLLPEQKKLVKKIDGPGSAVKTIYANQNQIYIGYQSHGVVSYTLNKDLTVDTSAKTQMEELKTKPIRKIWRDTRQRLWIGTYNGLYMWYNSELTHFNTEEFSGLPHNSIFEIFEDSQGGIWFGTWSGGVAYLHHSDNKFVNYQHSKVPHSLSNNMISSFAQTDDGSIYVGTEAGGLNLFDSTQGTFKKINVDNTNSLINVKALATDKYGGLWVGTAFDGLWYKAKNTDRFQNFKLGSEDGQHISSPGAFALCASDSGIWIGTTENGLNFYNFATKKIQFKQQTSPFSLFGNQAIRSIYIDSNNNLWAGSLGGLYRVNLDHNSITEFTPKSVSNHKTKSQTFFYITELNDGKIWIGTNGDGINIYDPTIDSIYTFIANGYLKNKDVYGILQARENHIWATSNNGLVVYDTKENHARNFKISDGMQGDLYNPNAVFIDRDRNLYFGGTNGFSVFEPENIKINNRPPNAFITKIEVNNEPISPIQTDVGRYAEITLKPEENTLKFYFSADNYLLPEKNDFKYRLINYLDNWIGKDKETSATFVNLPAGEYVFEVIASNNDGIWSKTPTRLSITVKQFWYKSTLAILVYIIALLSTILFYAKVYISRAKFKKEIAIQNIERSHAEELHEMKLKFFTNISHEFRTPLTLIDLPIKKLLQSTNITSEQIDQLQTVKRNTNRLLQLINQIMDLRKVEKGQQKLNISSLNLIALTNELSLTFSEEAKSKEIQVNFIKESDSLTIEADEEKLDKMIYNLLSNAFKFVPIKGRINISIKDNSTVQNNSIYLNQLSFGKLESTEFVEIAITDNGEGIDSEDVYKIFNRFEQGKQSSSRINSTGIGLSLCKEFTLMHHGIITVQSTPGKGTRFAIRLPIKQNAQHMLYQSHQEVKNISSWNTSSNNEETLEEEQKERSTLLVVEDNIDLRDFIEKLLKDYYTVLTAENGAQGLETINNNSNIQLVVSDVMMPIMDGFELCQKIKSKIETSHIPVILLTALSSADNKAIGLEQGADAYISKPFDETVLLAQIKNLIKQRKRLQHSFAQRYMTDQPVEIGSLDNYFLNKLNITIEDNIENEFFSVEKLAEEVGLSRSQLHRKLKQITDKTTSEYIMMVRIKNATLLLTKGEHNIDEVAFKTGFNSHSYFTKSFKKIHNQSPKEYLKKYSDRQ